LPGEGASVAVVDWHGDVADEVAGEITQKGGQAASIRCDVSVGREVKAMVARSSRGSVPLTC